jgi:hypothetical protein
MNTPSKSNLLATSAERPKWWKRGITKFLWLYAFAWGAGTIAMIMLQRFGPPHKVDFGLLMLPGLIVAVMIIPAAYSQGVRDGREHPST